MSNTNFVSSYFTFINSPPTNHIIQFPFSLQHNPTKKKHLTKRSKDEKVTNVSWSTGCGMCLTRFCFVRYAIKKQNHILLIKRALFSHVLMSTTCWMLWLSCWIVVVSDVQTQLDTCFRLSFLWWFFDWFICLFQHAAFQCHLP